MKKRFLAFAASQIFLACAFFAQDANALTPDNPGVSVNLYSAPYYSCQRNFYVSTAGSDSNAGTKAAPWRTLQHANDMGRKAGDCVNVEPGTYADGVLINSGGNLASSTGYVVYRCTGLDACVIKSSSGFIWNTSVHPMGGSYIIIDGFQLSATSAVSYGQGIELWTGSNTFNFSVHHVWIINNIITNFGQSGIQMNEGEYFFVIHNRILNNSMATCSAQGSGISFASLIQAPGYKRTADDNKTSVYGSIGSSIHNVIMWNDVHNNAILSCGTASNPYDTDGNNIILDTLSWNHGAGQIDGGVPYTPSVLVAFNTVYNGGGGGVHVAWSQNDIVANNSCYNNYIDPYNTASGRGCIDAEFSFGGIYINNVAVAIPAAPVAGCAFNEPPYAQFNAAFLGSPPSGLSPNKWTHNISQEQGGNYDCWGALGNDSPTGEAVMFNGDVYSCEHNLCSTDPEWDGMGNSSTGTETKTPVGNNFGLLSKSPAIYYGAVPVPTYLPFEAADAGACYHTLTVCPVQ